MVVIVSTPLFVLTL